MAEERRTEGGGRREEGGGRREEGGGRREEGGGRREEGGGRRAERRSGEHTGSTIVVRDERLNIVISGEVLYCTQLCRNESLQEIKEKGTAEREEGSRVQRGGGEGQGHIYLDT